MIYGLWELSTGNLLATFDSEAEAARVAGEFLASYGQDFARNIEITTENSEGKVTTVASGDALARLVQSAAVASPPGSGR